MGYFYGIEMTKNGEAFTDEECEWLIRGFLSKRLLELGLICRADDRGDPVIQLSPPLVAGPEEFEASIGRRSSARPSLEAWKELDVGDEGRRRSSAIARLQGIVGAGVGDMSRRRSTRRHPRAPATAARRTRSSAPWSGCRRPPCASGCSASSTAGVMQIVAVTDPAMLGLGLQAMIGSADRGRRRGRAAAVTDVTTSSTW